MARRLVGLASAIVGRRRAGLAYVSTLTCMLFGAISGSAAAAVSSVGGMMIPEMARKGYGRPLSVAIATTAATTGLIIPPSNIMIVYALVAGGVSVAAIFMAGVFPGILVGVAIMIACRFICPEEIEDESVVKPSILKSAMDALPSLLLIIIVLGAILGGVCSPTEAAAVAVLYAFLLAVLVYREVPIGNLPRMCLQTGITTSVIFFLIAASQAMSWVMTAENLPQTVSSALLGLSENRWVILVIINIILLVVGAFMDMTPAVLIFTPIFLPMAVQLGMHPVHFGVMMIANLCIGLCTPPVGTCLFIGCGVGKTTIAEVVRPMTPLILAMIAAVAIIAAIPELSLWLPRAMGLLE
jgi:tripartite ATP-independent transporter DctM subunit